MNIDGSNGLACLKAVIPEEEADSATDGQRTVSIFPLPHMPVVRDLVVDMADFYEQHKAVRPWLELSEAEYAQPKELIQSIEDRDKLDGLYECILCACCTTSCPSYWWSQEGSSQYLGPAALLQAYRWVQDSRDTRREERLAELAVDENKMYKCHTIMNCSKTCPKGLNPGAAIQDMKRLTRNLDEPDATPAKDLLVA